MFEIFNLSATDESEVFSVVVGGFSQHRALHAEGIILTEFRDVSVDVIAASRGVWVSICEEFIVELNPGLNNICGVLNNWIDFFQAIPPDSKVDTRVNFSLLKASDYHHLDPVPVVQVHLEFQLDISLSELNVVVHEVLIPVQSVIDLSVQIGLPSGILCLHENWDTIGYKVLTDFFTNCAQCLPIDISNGDATPVNFHQFVLNAPKVVVKGNWKISDAFCNSLVAGITYLATYNTNLLQELVLLIDHVIDKVVEINWKRG